MKTMNPSNFVFLSPYWLFLLIFVPVLGWYYYQTHAHALPLRRLSHQHVPRISPALLIQSILVSILVGIGIFILANPKLTTQKETITKKGIDLVIALDVSISMDAPDMNATRIEVAKEMLSTFVSTITSDRVGLVVFAGKPFVSIPLTFDTNIIKTSIENTNTQTINQYFEDLSGTAIGDALLMARNLFVSKKDEEKKREKVVILLTDGDANVGVEPTLAGQLLAKDGIKIYSIGIGSATGKILKMKNGALIPVPPLNGEALQQIASITGGKYFRALDEKSLENVFSELKKLQKHDLDASTTTLYTPIYSPFVWLGILCMLGYGWILFFHQPLVWNSKNGLGHG